MATEVWRACLQKGTQDLMASRVLIRTILLFILNAFFCQAFCVLLGNHGALKIY